MHFDTRDDVPLWIADNQFGRRDLTTYERSVLALKLKPVFAAKAKERMTEGTNQYTSPVKISCQGSEELPPPKPVREQKTDYQVAQKAGVSEQVALAKIELGKRISELPKAGHSQYTQAQIDIPVEKQKPKSEAIAELGLTQKQAERTDILENSTKVHQSTPKKKLLRRRISAADTFAGAKQ